jgi:hypothetical protein
MHKFKPFLAGIGLLTPASALPPRASHISWQLRARCQRQVGPI